MTTTSHVLQASLVLGLLLLGGCGREQPEHQAQRPAETASTASHHQQKSHRAASSSTSSSAKAVQKQPDAAAGQARAKAVQAIFNQYDKQIGVNAVYTDLATKASATLHGDQPIYAASVAKLPIVAAVQAQIVAGQLSWDTAFPYDAAANNLPNAMVAGGTGNLQYENHQGKQYTVQDLMQRTIEHSDNQASNQLLQHVAMAKPAVFNAYLKTNLGMAVYSKTMTAMQANRAIIAVWQQQQPSQTWLEQTDWARVKIGTLPVTVAHKIGMNGAFNHDAAIVLGAHPFALTILTNGWSDAQIAALAQRIFSAVK